MIVLCYRHLWNKLLARIKQLPARAVVAELFSPDENEATAFTIAAPVEVLESIMGKLDAEKRNILDIADLFFRLPLHHTAWRHPDPAAIKLLVRHHHPALLAKTNSYHIPLDHAIEHNKSPAVAALLRKLTTAYKHGHFPGLIRLCGTSPTLEAVAVRSTDDVSLLVLCRCDSWEAAGKRMETIPTQDAIEEMHQQDEEGHTAFATAVVDAPVELLESMVELGKQDTKKRKIVMVCDKKDYYPMDLAAMHRSDAATIKLLARENPSALYYALECALVRNKKSTAVVTLLRKCLAAWEQGNISALIDLCGESDRLLMDEEFVERHPVHFAAWYASAIAILKPVIRDRAPQLLTEDCEGRTPLNNATKYNKHPAVVSFVTEVDAAFHNTDYPALIKLCGSTPDWEKKAQYYTDKKKANAEVAADKLAAEFFEWDEKDSKKKQPEKKKKKPKKKKEKKEEALMLSLAEQMAAVDAQLASLPKLSEPTPPPPPQQTDSAVLAAVYSKLFDTPPHKKMKITVLAACEDVVGLPSDGAMEERVAALKLLVHKRNKVICCTREMYSLYSTAVR